MSQDKRILGIREEAFVAGVFATAVFAGAIFLIVKVLDEVRETWAAFAWILGIGLIALATIYATIRAGLDRT